MFQFKYDIIPIIIDSKQKIEITCFEVNLDFPLSDPQKEKGK